MTIKLNENLIIFRIRFNSYKYLIFFFELIKDFAIFQNFINDTSINYFDKFVVAYLNDIFIYNNNIKKHKKHVQIFFRKFRKTDIQTNIDKCEFHKIETKFLNVLIEKKWNSHKFDQNRRNRRVKIVKKFDSNSIIFRICQFLSTIYKKIFENSENANAYDEKIFWIRMNICLQISFSKI